MRVCAPNPQLHLHSGVVRTIDVFDREERVGVTDYGVTVRAEDQGAQALAGGWWWLVVVGGGWWWVVVGGGGLWWVVVGGGGWWWLGVSG